ncbi:hypothetical protein ABOM_004844 [Aspergillus bombycis]|uniref:Peroxisomal D3 n=1 Tax=Aspergillus bombycis TaxID=109264 RepID=A0A1F8A3B4_9EURO|nr:hypothetical protein ABOM_004844 [Aspergillus bombycis]OGM46173.1 hypothetical protein ABOM_004844 [Aspergillus bombycis]
MAANQVVSVEYITKVATVTLDKAQKLNALSHDDYYRLALVLREIAQKDELLATLLIGTGRFFSTLRMPSGADIPRHCLPALVVNNINLESGRCLPLASKILVAALNGPVIGLSAALIAHPHLIFATPETYLLTPFSSLGIVTEGRSSIAFASSMGLSKAKEALLFSRWISIEELKQTGFVNQVFDTPGEGEIAGSGRDPP